MVKQTILAIIPARANSKRIPHKNIRSFLGKPLISYTIKQAKTCNFISRVIVDTDSLEIAKIARKYGAEVPQLRPAYLATDKSKVVNSILFCLKTLKAKENYQPDYVMILQTTSPLREKKDLEDCWNMMLKTNSDTVLTVCPTHPRLYYLTKNNRLILVNGKKNRSTNIQQWRSAYVLNGCFVYIIRTSALLKEKEIITKNTRAVISPRWRSVDLDTFEDWGMAEFLYKNRTKISKRMKELYEKK